MNLDHLIGDQAALLTPFVAVRVSFARGNALATFGDSRCLIDNSVVFENHQTVSRLLFVVDGVGVDAGSVWLEGRFIRSLKPRLD